MMMQHILLAFSLVLLTGALAEKEAVAVTLFGDKWRAPKIPGATVTPYTKVRLGQAAPVATGVRFSKELLDNAMSLPCFNFTEGTAVFCGLNINLLPPTARGVSMPFKWIKLGWQQKGHQPVGVYSVPHFDVHFYFDTQSYWEGQVFNATNTGPCVGASRQVMYTANKPVPKACYPASGAYNNVNGFVYTEGNHLINFAAPENNGKNFTETFIWGMYDGSLTYMEPMVTLKLLRELRPGSEVCSAIPVPAEFPEAGIYPTRYCIRKDALGAALVESTSFKPFPGCRGAPPLVGYLIAPAPPGCPVPQPPAKTAAAAKKP